ncbi:hypothetical protein EJF36_12290 [Bacillus sp. HMF5848]|uniref:hypothetical protein n=1 Tax=Bacillus sp. HMF5848 TaxID=2495421 RepID=UPI000F7A7FEA|nr:hypothetical protein [Bacillus sp. HMF5848]RSK27594.1 hypothetical protein EJF36_12290 [Bacillus sp. HMF5848]
MEKELNIGLYASALFTICIIALDISYLFLFANPNPWTGFDHYVSNYSFIEVWPEVIGFILLPSFVITIYSIIQANNLEKSIVAKTSIFFAQAFVVVVSIGYFIQFAVVYPNIHSGSGRLYELWLFGNTSYSLAWALNYLGWFWSGLSTIFLAFAIKDKVLQKLFVLYGALLSLAFVGYCTKFEKLEMVLGLAWFVVLPVAFIRVTILFSRLLKGKIQTI